MQANAFALPLPFNYLRLPPLNPTLWRVQLPPYQPVLGAKSPPLLRAVKKSKEEFGAEDDKEYGRLPKEFYDDEWQARQREKAKEWEEYRQKEEEKEIRKIDEYREIGMRLKGYPEEEVRKARKLVSSFIRSTEEVEEKIEEAAEKGELNELVLMVIWNRLDLARRDKAAVYDESHFTGEHKTCTGNQMKYLYFWVMLLKDMNTGANTCIPATKNLHG